jgi:hypothetical protein
LSPRRRVRANTHRKRQARLPKAASLRSGSRRPVTAAVRQFLNALLLAQRAVAKLD